MMVLSYLLMTLLLFSGLFLICLVLLQRGRGGGLAGALGGMGGQSALGTKAGDVFTKITIGVASAWILLCAVGVIVLHNSGERISGSVIKKDDASETKKADAKETAKDGDKIDVPLAGPKTDDTSLPPGVDSVKPNNVNVPAAPGETAPANKGDAEKAPSSDEKPATEKPAPEKTGDEKKPAEPASGDGTAAKPEGGEGDKKDPDAKPDAAASDKPQ